jgi:hypothetical protein
MDGEPKLHKLSSPRGVEERSNDGGEKTEDCGEMRLEGRSYRLTSDRLSPNAKRDRGSN